MNKTTEAPKAEDQYSHKAHSSFDIKGDLAGKWLESTFFLWWLRLQH
jgi:hypothetical protein